MPEPARPQETFGPNAWLVDEMYEQFRDDPDSVSESWQEFFEGYRPGGANLTRPVRADTDGGGEGNGAAVAREDNGWGGPQPEAKPEAKPSAKPSAEPAPPPEAPARPAKRTDEDVPQASGTPIRGAAARIVSNMAASLGVPTATSFRVVPARLLEVNRRILNNQLSRVLSSGKVSFTHLIGYAIVEAIRSVPVLNSTFVAGDKPSVIHHEHLGLGIAVDTSKSDGSHTLLVPVIKDADTLSFRAFWTAYEDLIRKVRQGKIAADDFVGATVSLTNPGTIGTVQSVPRLMPGQGAIIGVGTIDYPAEWQAADSRVLADLGVSKVVTITSTYDHRIIQGAESGLFLRRVHELLTGADGFFERIFSDMGVPYEPVEYHTDDNDPGSASDTHLRKQIEVEKLINIHRVRGHLIAHLDPLDAKPPHMHAELDPATYGLTVWDLEREFMAHDLGADDRMKLGDILGLLRDAYCRTVGVEYMHISDPAQKRWIQQQVEGVATQLEPEEHRWILARLNAADALEQFLNTKYIGQKRFGLEGGEAAIPLVDSILDAAAVAGQDSAVIGMAHRGRLNMLINIVGKTYSDLFGEFEGNIDPGTVQGSGDVKYHKGFRGTFTGRSGTSIDVQLSSNPSHLEAVDPVVEGMARARQDQLIGSATAHPVLPLLIHGDAAFSGQGVVAETLNMSALPGYETGGTVHLVINNQLGFTTNPESARSSIYSSDVAKIVQAPIFHVNGDDPEACVRVGRLAFAFRQTFHKDVVIDMVCYRRFGHNEQDDPSLTQPILYQLIQEHRSVRKLYTEALVRRGDITVEEAEEALKDFSARLQAALDETRASAPPEAAELPPAPEPAPVLPPVATGVDAATLQRVVDRLSTSPDGFTVHPKLIKVFESRAKLWADGQADWALGEALAYGTLVLEGHDVRLSGQDTRRGTFGHRNAALVDHRTGSEWVPLEHLSLSDDGGDGASLGRFFIYDSLLSEYAAVGFEYGYSLVQRRALVAWEAQFGDFINGAQIVIDQFLAAAEIKWAQTSGLTLLLPHGYEGQGAEHSSARMERFLDLCAEDNMQVADVTTSAQLFHLLRRQVHRDSHKPLVLFTPKRYLRGRESRSPAAEFTTGHFREVLDDVGISGDAVGGGEGRVRDPGPVRRLVLATGKVAIDATVARDKASRDDVAIVRVEQLYPWPAEQIADILARYAEATEVIWLQEEPENMGAWGFVRDRLARLVSSAGSSGQPRHLERVSRVASGSPATGSHAMHDLEQADLLARALG